MRPNICRTVLPLLILMTVGVTLAVAQKGQSSSSSPSAPASGSGTGLPGVVYASGFVPITPPTHVRIMCFDLEVVSDNSGQPFILQPTAHTDKFPAKTCSIVDEQHPLMAGDLLSVAVYTGDVDSGTARPRILAISINPTVQAALTLNASPVRPSLTNVASSIAGNGVLADVFYLTWPNKLNGDTIPTITLNALYHPPLPVSVQTTSPVQLDANKSPITQPLMVTSELGTVPYADQSFQALSFTLPQVHPKYSYNVSNGVAVSFIHNPRFTRVANPPAQGSTTVTSYTIQQTNGNILINPIILFSAYILPMDAERSWNIRDLVPAPALGFSLSSPAASFFFGATTEIRRNVQLVGGVNLAKVTTLLPSGFVDPSSSTAPATQQVFKPGGFVGLTFNINFITSLFSGGGSK
jgi:hypothetical protein